MTDLGDFRLRIVPGDGLVARLGAATAVVIPQTPEQGELAERLFELVAAEGSRGRRMARRLAAMLSDAEPEETPSFSVVAPEGDGVVVVVHGDVETTVVSTHGGERVSARSSATWLDRVFAGPVTGIVIGADDAVAAPRTDLRSGVAVGVGAFLAPADTEPVDEPTAIGAVAAAAAPAPPGVDPAPDAALDASVVIVDLNAPADVAVPEEPPELVTAGGARVVGILCSRQHFNDPSSLYCSVCGISMVQQTHNLVDGERPPLGVLVRDDGATFVLDSAYVIGRDPHREASVVSGAALPLVLEDRERTISRVHAHVGLRDWDVVLADAGSANGTFHAPPGSDEWERVPDDHPVTLLPGSRVLIGERTFVFETNRRR